MPSAATWMQLEIIIQGKSDRQILYGITYMWNLKYDTNESMKHKRIMDIENRPVAAKEERE